jgi:hypothetical protein
MVRPKFFCKLSKNQFSTIIIFSFFCRKNDTSFNNITYDVIFFTGDACEDIDECAESEAKVQNDPENIKKICNNGICQNKEGSYECFCRPGFGGQHCDYDFPECLSDPCQHGGTCKDKVNAFICDCPPGYEGM